ncbi:MAG: hypothetical protein ACJ8AI_27825 [Rhodopila sp.]
MFSVGGYPSAMTEIPPALRPASPEEVAETIAFALRYNGRRRVHDADSMTARIAAERLVAHLQASGFVLMRKPPSPAPTTSMMPKPAE